MPTKRDKRDAAIAIQVWIALISLAVVVVWHWIFDGHYGYLAAVACWSALALIGLWLLNALGTFSRR